MAVEIVILSGARQAERLFLEQPEFRAGDDPNCEVFFDPRSDPAAEDRCALFRLADDGWFIERIGAGELFVNQQPVMGSTRIRSGDLVRMSERGPDFSFSVVARATAFSASPAAAAPPVSLPAGGATIWEEGAQLAPQPAPPSRPEPACQPALEAQPASAGQPLSAPPPRGYPAASAEPWRHAFWAVVALAVCILVFVAVFSLMLGRLVGQRDTGLQAPQATARAKQTGSGTGQTDGPTEGPPEQGPKPPLPAQQTGSGTQQSGETTDGPPQKEPKGPSEDSPPPPPQDPWTKVSEELRDAVFMIEVGAQSSEGEFRWPFATCCAISEDTLLTSAVEACTLAVNWHQKEGRKVWVTNRAKGIEEEVQDIRVHSAFIKVADKPTHRIFENLGLLTVQGKLPKIASLASSDELGKLEDGLPVAWFGFSYEEVEKITRFDTFQPQLIPGGIYLREPRDRPKLLHVRARIPAKAYGGPIVNAQGKVIAVYGEAAPPESTPVKDLHYVTVVDPESINLWLQKRDTGVWVRPVMPETPPSP